jgi:hypothetical protein
VAVVVDEEGTGEVRLRLLMAWRIKRDMVKVDDVSLSSLPTRLPGGSNNTGIDAEDFFALHDCAGFEGHCHLSLTSLYL